MTKSLLAPLVLTLVVSAPYAVSAAEEQQGSSLTAAQVAAQEPAAQATAEQATTAQATTAQAMTAVSQAAAAQATAQIEAPAEAPTISSSQVPMMPQTPTAVDTVKEVPQSVIEALHISNFERVSDKLWRGGVPSQESLKKLKDAGVHTIVDLRMDGGGITQEQAETKELGLQYVHVPLGFASPSREKLTAVLKVLNDPQLQPIYIHCRQGADRTGMCVAIYRILNDKCSFDQAYGEMRSHHFKPFLITMKRTVRSFANKSYQFDEVHGVTASGDGQAAAKVAAKSHRHSL